jgi:hypothetical protein
LTVCSVRGAPAHTQAQAAERRVEAQLAAEHREMHAAEIARISTSQRFRVSYGSPINAHSSSFEDGHVIKNGRCQDEDAQAKLARKKSLAAKRPDGKIAAKLEGSGAKRNHLAHMAPPGRLNFERAVRETLDFVSFFLKSR